MDYETYPACPELLPRLHKEQNRKGYVSEEAMKKISRELKMPVSRIYAAASFYANIYTQKQGKYLIEICNSPSCYLNGSIDIIKIIERELKIKSGETTKNGRFSLHIGSCIGCCDKAPAMMINKKIYTNLTEAKVLELLKKCRY